MALPERPVICIEEYLSLDESSTDARYEYLDGAIKMLAGGSVYHSLIAANVTGMLYGHLRNGPCRVYNSDIRLQLSASRYVYPDVTVSCDPRDQEQGNTIHYPRVVFEILSPGTEVTDRIVKLVYYRECPSIQEYVMVDSQKYLVDIYHRQKDGWLLQTLQPADILVLESLNACLPIKDIYERIHF